MIIIFTFGIFLSTILSYGSVGGSIVLEVNQDTEIPPEDPWTMIDNGTHVNITAGTRTQLRTQSGNHIRLRVNESVQLQLDECECNPVGPLFNQTRAVNRFMHIELNGTVNMTATMFRNYTNANLKELGNVSTFRWAFYNESTFRWQYAYENWIEHTEDGAKVFCKTDHFSYWTIVAPDMAEEPVMNPTPGTPFNPTNGTGFVVQAQNQYEIQTQAGFQIQLQLNKSAEITVEEYERSPKPMNRERHRIRTQTMAIELNVSTPLNATFAYQFTNQIKNQLNVSNMNKLKFMFFNESSQEWETPQHQWIEGETLYCNTTHFSLWTIAEEDSTDSSTPSFSIFPLLAVLSALVIFSRRK